MISILTAGNWTSDQVHVTWRADSRLRRPDVDRLIDETWSAAMVRPGIKLFDGPMCRLEAWHAEPRSLHLELSQTSYKIFMGTNLTHSELADVHGPNVLANPLGVSAALLTVDGFLMLGRRNAAVAYYPNRIHPFAGSLEPSDGADVFAAVRRELAEEIHFVVDDIAEIRCCGIVEDSALRQPELIFRVTSNRTREEVQQRVDVGEHCGSWSVTATPEAIGQAVRNPELTPVAVGSLLLWGRSEFGEDFLTRCGADVWK